MLKPLADAAIVILLDDLDDEEDNIDEIVKELNDVAGEVHLEVRAPLCTRLSTRPFGG